MHRRFNITKFVREYNWLGIVDEIILKPSINMNARFVSRPISLGIGPWKGLVDNPISYVNDYRKHIMKTYEVYLSNLNLT